MSNILFSLNQVEEKHYSELAAVVQTCLQPPVCLALHGNLGAGKTSFARCFIRTYLNDMDMEVPSPTFTLAQQYSCANKADIWHYDFYRIDNPDEIYEIGFDENIQDSIGIIEWPEKIAHHLPSDTLFIEFKINKNKNSRKLNFISSQAWKNLLEKLKSHPKLAILLNNENKLT